MEPILDLDSCAREIESRRAEWVRAGLTVGPLTWRDAAEPWPWPLHTDRAAVGDPDSVGVMLDYEDGPAGSIVLFRGGWADVDLLDLTANEVITSAPEVPTPAAFAAVLNAATHHLLRPLSGAWGPGQRRGTE
ncbi:hypothetical protein GCM10010174_26260 [Kutzneria viridogrisea]|uniref:Immunity protein Imm1 n=1 Tax=Kutzneria viridogrisea TaxID=47990 RepID=A0ABR6BS90_9PSEU|nr:hypothetical protein [Kutzneria albida]MBA8929550.1 hypothetical protein [Kutzneria viridogrisea]